MPLAAPYRCRKERETILEHLEKPPIRKPVFLLKCILGPILLIIIAFLTSTCVQEGLRYRTVTADPLTLEAYITHVETIIDTDNGDDYDAMMRYSYGGETYVDTYRRFSRESGRRAAGWQDGYYPGGPQFSGYYT